MRKLIFLLLMSLVASLAGAQFLEQPVYGTLQIEREKSPPVEKATLNEKIVEADLTNIATRAIWQDPVELYVTVEKPFCDNVYLQTRYIYDVYRDSYCYKFKDHYYPLITCLERYDKSPCTLPVRAGDR